jgi:hypothetical protein
LSWRDLYVLVRGFQRDPTSATSTSLHGTHWSVTDQLLAGLYDLLQNANWLLQKQLNPKKSVPRPKPLQRPWQKSKSQRLGSEPIAIAAFDAWWDQAGEEANGGRGSGTRNSLGPGGPDAGGRSGVDH